MQIADPAGWHAASSQKDRHRTTLDTAAVLRSVRQITSATAVVCQPEAAIGPGCQGADDAVPKTEIKKVLKERAQRASASARTDRDRFSVDECRGPMCAGHRLAEHGLTRTPFVLATPTPADRPRGFPRAADRMDGGEPPNEDAARGMERGR